MRRVQVYQLFNSQDLSKKNKMMTEEMREICLSEGCTRKLLKSYFVGDAGVEGDELKYDETHCCHSCDRFR